MRRGKVREYSKGTGCDNSPPPPLPLFHPLSGVKPRNPEGNLPAVQTNSSQWTFQPWSFCVECYVFELLVGVFGGGGSVIELCDDAQTSAACMSLYFGLSLKCLWNVVPDQHTSTTGLTSSLILLYGLSDYTFLLCVHFELLHPDDWWVKMNIILCFNLFWYFKLLTSVFGGCHTCCLLSHYMSGNNWRTYWSRLSLVLWP